MKYLISLNGLSNKKQRPELYVKLQRHARGNRDLSALSQVMSLGQNKAKENLLVVVRAILIIALMPLT